MGQHLMRRPPKFVQGFIDRHGKARFYFRRAGFKPVPLPGLPWSPEFMAAYEQSLAGQPLQIGSARTKLGTVRALAVSYFNSSDFRSLTPSSQAIYRGVIDRFCIQYGDNRVAGLKREHVVRLMAARAERPVAANTLRKVLRVMMKHAVEIGLRADDPTRDVRAIRVKSDGFHSWNDDEIAQFEKRQPIGTPARLALALWLYTGQRRSDVVRMGPQHIRNGVLGVRQQKTGFELAIPVHSTLAAVIAKTPTYHLTFLTNQFGRPFTAGYFGQWFREQCDMAGLRHCSAHGLRKAAARRLAEAGCTAHEIAAITGHASLKEVARYTAAVDRKQLAESAMAKVRTLSVKPGRRFDKKR
jgi:integrase